MNTNWYTIISGKGCKGKAAKLAKAFKAEGMNVKVEYLETARCGNEFICRPRYSVIVSGNGPDFENHCESIKAQTI